MEIARLRKQIGPRPRLDWTTPMRLGAIFVAVCMVIIAGFAGAIAYFYLGVERFGGRHRRAWRP